jgi:hypothetical protein
MVWIITALFPVASTYTRAKWRPQNEMKQRKVLLKHHVPLSKTPHLLASPINLFFWEQRFTCIVVLLFGGLRSTAQDIRLCLADMQPILDIRCRRTTGRPWSILRTPNKKQTIILIASIWHFQLVHSPWEESVRPGLTKYYRAAWYKQLLHWTVEELSKSYPIRNGPNQDDLSRSLM